MHYDQDTLDDYLHGELDAGRDAAIHAHLAGCAACRLQYDEAAGLRDWIRAAAQADERELPAMVRARVWEAVRTAPPTPFQRLQAFWRPLLAVPLAAAVAIVAYVGLPVFQPAHAGVTAAYLLEEHAAGTAENPLADHGLVVPASFTSANTALMGTADASTLSDDGSDQH